MGFHEDDRIRNKNRVYVEDGTGEEEQPLKLVFDDRETDIGELVKWLIQSGYKVDYTEHNKTIKVTKGESDEVVDDATDSINPDHPDGP